MIINLLNVSFEFSGGVELFKDLSFTLDQGEVVYLHGSSGCGKSTFLKLLNRLIEPTAGVMEFMGRPYASQDVLELRRNIQLVHQTPFLFPVSVEENLRMANRSLNVSKAVELFQAFNLSESLLYQNGNCLSVGQAQRVCVIRSLLIEPKVMLMDEPTAVLDPQNRELFNRTLEEIRGSLGFAVVWVTHEGVLAYERGGRHLTLSGGVFHGD